VREYQKTIIYYGDSISEEFEEQVVLFDGVQKKKLEGWVR
jgi:hypothetical protein